MTDYRGMFKYIIHVWGWLFIQKFKGMYTTALFKSIPDIQPVNLIELFISYMSRIP